MEKKEEKSCIKASLQWNGDRKNEGEAIWWTYGCNAL